jgi:hypothetical protein
MAILPRKNHQIRRLLVGNRSNGSGIAAGEERLMLGPNRSAPTGLRCLAEV